MDVVSLFWISMDISWVKIIGLFHEMGVTPYLGMGYPLLNKHSY
jgi:hypothetical protein